MAYYNQDPFSAQIGEFETEEQRRRRLAEQQANQPVKQTIVTNPDGTQEVTIRGTPEALSAANPRTPTIVQPGEQYQPPPVRFRPTGEPVSGPMAPTFQRMLQAESGNQQFTPQGQVLTSPRGAMGAAQIMPSTAMQPGYGVPSIFDMAQRQGLQVPARDEATARQLLANEQLNRQFGQAYFDAMRRQFPGSEAQAVAAYNAGPGRTQQAQARGGASWMNYMPGETQRYVNQVSGTPQAQPGPGTAVATPTGIQGTMEQPPVPNQYSLAQGVSAAPGFQIPVGPPTIGAPRPAQAPAEGFTPTQLGIDRFTLNQNNLQNLLAMRDDQSVPDYLRDRAGRRAQELLQTDYARRDAEQQLRSLNETDLARVLREKTTGGSWLKALAFSALGMERSAQAEAAKLGIGTFQSSMVEGRPVMIKVAANGTPLEGYDASTGKALNANELVSAMAGAAGGKITTSGTFFQTAQGQILRAQSDERGGTRLVDASTGTRYTGSTQGLTKLEEAAGLRRMDRQLVVDLARKHGQNVLEAEKEYVNLNGPFRTPEERSQFREAYGFGMAQPAPVPGVAPLGGQPAAQPAPQPAVQPAPQPAAQFAPQPPQARPPAAPVQPTVPTPLPAAAPAAGSVTRPLAEQQMQRQAQAEQAKQVAQEVGGDIGKARVNQGRAESNADYLIGKVDELIKHPGFEVSVGASVQPGFQFIAGTDKADWYSRFGEIQGQQFIQGIENLRGTGAITEKEGAAARSAISRMSTLQSEAEFRAAAQDFQDIVKRGIDRTRRKLGQELKYGTPEESELQKQREETRGRTESGVRWRVVK